MGCVLYRGPGHFSHRLFGGRFDRECFRVQERAEPGFPGLSVLSPQQLCLYDCKQQSSLRPITCGVWNLDAVGAVGGRTGEHKEGRMGHAHSGVSSPFHPCHHSKRQMEKHSSLGQPSRQIPEHVKAEAGFEPKMCLCQGL